MSLIRIGRLGRPHGIAGEMYLDDCGLTPEELEAVGAFGWRGARGETRTVTLRSVRPAAARLLVAFEGFHSREAASELTNGDLQADESRLPDPGPGVAYAFQIVGCEVRTGDGRSLGTVREVMTQTAQPIYVVAGARELMVPVTPEIVKHVDLGARIITVELPAGLEDL